MKRILDAIKAVKLSGVTLGALVLLGVGILLYGGLTLFTGTFSTKSAAARVDDTRCPDCGHEYSRADMASKECTFCRVTSGKTDEKPKPGRKAAAAQGGWLVPAILIGVFVVLLGVHLTVLYRQRAAATKEEVYYTTECLKCNRRIRYRENQVGKPVRCPNLKCKAFIRCPLPEKEAPRTWMQWAGLERKAAPSKAENTE